MKEELIRKIQSKTLVMGVCGLGYVGLPLAVDKAKHGFQTIGFDVQQEKVDLVNAGKNYIGDVVNADLEELVKTGKLRATSDFSFVKDVDFIAICVPTPLDKHQQPDISFVRDSTIAISKHLTRGSIVVLESTTYPGTTEELLKPILEEGSGLKCGVDFYLGFSPERIDPGNLIYKTSNTPKVVGAIGADATEVIAKVYRAILEGDVTTVSSPAVAEMEKILENTYRNVNIGLINELAILCNKMHINIWEVVDAAKTKPYGFQAFYPGPGLGGHCIPLDPYYLSWKAREYGFHTSMIEASMMVNDRMPEYTVERAGKILNRYRKALNGSKVLVLGAAYKQDIDDYRESPAVRVMAEFRKTGALIDYYDPYVPKFRDSGKWYERIPALTPEAVKNYDLVTIATAHTKVDYAMVASCGVPVFDCKNVCKNISNRENIEVL
ncbi:MAG: nucleotide sugar dehydrogenase [Oscillibacter sp.]|nr:nucleotide sugar dehydrogenase [Oscillibacter sp.]